MLPLPSTTTEEYLAALIAEVRALRLAVERLHETQGVASVPGAVIALGGVELHAVGEQS